MALTPEDVVNKRFQPTKFREGYDQDEVDDFLDEVVVELRRLNQENEELRQRLMAADQRINQLQSAPQPQGAPQMAAAPQAAPPGYPVQGQPVQGQPIDPSVDQGSTNNLLQLARTLHEQHVREGIEKRDALIAEGQATAARVVQEAEQQQRAQNSTLEQERQQLEFRIEELRNFERDYRAKLKGYIEGQLRDLDSSSVVSQPSAQAQAQTQPQQGYEAPAQAYGATPAYGGPQAPQGYPGFAGQ
jgi:DivIVA domain-containing protein